MQLTALDDGVLDDVDTFVGMLDMAEDMPASRPAPVVPRSPSGERSGTPVPLSAGGDTGESSTSSNKHYTQRSCNSHQLYGLDSTVRLCSRSR